VVNAYARSPWLLGITARDLDEVSGGRLILGIGTGNLHMNDWYQGVDSSKPVHKMRDYVQIVRGMLRTPLGETFHHEGPQHSIRWSPMTGLRRPSVPVHLAGSGPGLIGLAGEVSDGVGIGILASPDHVRSFVRPTALAGAARVGRPEGDIAFPMGAWFSVNENREAARAASRFAICGLFHPVPHPYYDTQLRQQGFAELADMASELMPAGRTREAMDRVPDEAVDALTISGTPEECLARLEAYEGVVDEVIALRVPQRNDPSGPDAFEGLLDVARLASRRSRA
jgi:5,10-methylenetetrahydromethanopterin reductase